MDYTVSCSTLKLEPNEEKFFDALCSYLKSENSNLFLYIHKPHPDVAGRVTLGIKIKGKMQYPVAYHPSFEEINRLVDSVESETFDRGIPLIGDCLLKKVKKIYKNAK